MRHVFARVGIRAHLHAFRLVDARDARQHRGGDAFGHEQRFHGVAGAIALRLRVIGDAHRHLGVGLVVDIDVAHAVQVLDHRDLRLADEALDQFLAAAWHDDVDVFAQPHQRSHGGAVGDADQLDRGLGQSGTLQSGAHAGGDGAIRFERLGAAAQDAGVTGLDAERRGIGGHVRARLVDDADYAERHAHASDLDAARLRCLPGDLPDGVG